MDKDPYAEGMFRWTLKDTLDAHDITRYALTKESGVAPNTINAMYSGTPTRVDFPVIERVIKALGVLTGRPMSAADVFVWERDTLAP